MSEHSQYNDWEELAKRLPIESGPDSAQLSAIKKRVLEIYDASAIGQRIPWKPGEILMTNRTLQATLVAVLLGCCVFFLRGEHGNAFALDKVLTTFKHARTGRYDVTIQLEGQPDRKMVVYFSESRSRTERSDGTVIIGNWQTGETLEFNKTTKKAERRHHGNPDDVATENRAKVIRTMRNQVNPFGELVDHLTLAKDVSEAEALGTKTIDGRTARGHKVVLDESKIADFWMDAENGDPLRIDITSGPLKLIYSKPEFNLKLDEENLFRLVPSAEYDSTPAPSRPGKREADFIRTLRGFCEARNGSFPDSLDYESGALGKSIEAYEKHIGLWDAARAKEAIPKKFAVMQGLEFLLSLPETSDLHYAGQGLRAGDSSPILWYRPDDSTGYRIVYGDFSVKTSLEPPKDDGAERPSLRTERD